MEKTQFVKVAAYCRVSTDREDQSNSFEAQRRYFREYIAGKEGWELYEIYADEGLSGTSTKKRAEFNRMISDAFAGKFQLIITKEVSRFSRNILDTIAYTRELRRRGIGVLFLTDRINTLNPEGEMLLSLLSSLAQEESRRTSERVVWGQTRQMERGVVFGGSLLGYGVEKGKVTVEPEGAEIVAQIFHQYAVAQMPASQIARELTEAGILTQRGNTRWTAASVIRILKNEKYAGDLVQKKTYTPDYLTHEKKPNTGQVPLIRLENHHTPLVSREIWNLAQERLRKNCRRRGGTDSHSDRLAFSGKIICGACGSVFVGQRKRQKDGSYLRRWRCAKAVKEGKGGCSVGKLLREDDAWRMFYTALNQLLRDSEMLSERIWAVLQETENVESDGLQREMDRIRRKKETVLDGFASGILHAEDVHIMVSKYDEQLKHLRIRVQACKERDKSDKEACVKSMIQDILSGNCQSDPFCKTLLQSITVFGDHHAQLRMKDMPAVFLFSL